MRRTPDKETIIRLREQKLTLAEIGKRYGVTGAAISWALHHAPNIQLFDVCHIPDHVINHWRNEWGWSEEKINQTILLYHQSLLKRNGGANRITKQPQALPESQPEQQRGRPVGSLNKEPITRPEFRRRRLRELFLKTKSQVIK